MLAPDYLDKIAAYKKEEVRLLIEKTRNHPEHALNIILKREGRKTCRFASALKQPELMIIAEVKRRSPSQGEFAKIEDSLMLAEKYCEGGAAAISVLTDNKSFGGSIDDLKIISQGLPHMPILRKEFIIHPLQLAEAVLAGATAVLLIVGLLQEDLKPLLDAAHRLGLETLTEVNNKEELELAVKAGALIIGVNHRNLRTFETNLHLSDELSPLFPSSVIRVAASGIHTVEDAKRMRALGYDAILVGQALVSTKNPDLLIQQMRGSYES